MESFIQGTEKPESCTLTQIQYQSAFNLFWEANRTAAKATEESGHDDTRPLLDRVVTYFKERRQPRSVFEHLLSLFPSVGKWSSIGADSRWDCIPYSPCGADRIQKEGISYCSPFGVPNYGEPFDFTRHVSLDAAMNPDTSPEKLRANNRINLDEGIRWFDFHYYKGQLRGKVLLYRVSDNIPMDPKNFLLYEQGKTVTTHEWKGPELKTKEVSLANLWFKTTTEVYNTTTFNPGLTPGKDLPTSSFNRWQGLKVAPKANPEKLQFFLDFTTEVICKGDEKIADWLFSYFAHMIQRPWELERSSIVLFGAEGIGKSFFVKTIALLLDGYYLSTDKSDSVVGNFNSILVDKLLINLNEAVFAGSPKDNEAIKAKITEETLTINRKMLPEEIVNNYARVIITTNQDVPVRANEGNRRYLILGVSERYKGDTAYWASYKRQMDDPEFAPALMFFLSSLDWSKVALDMPPMTADKAEVIKSGFSGAEAFMMEMVETGAIPGVDVQFEASDEEGFPSGTPIAKKLIYGAYLDHCSRWGRSQPWNTVRFWKKFKEWFPSVTEYKPGGEGRMVVLTHEKMKEDFTHLGVGPAS